MLLPSGWNSHSVVLIKFAQRMYMIQSKLQKLECSKPEYLAEE